MPEELINVTQNIKAAPLRGRSDFLTDTSRYKTPQLSDKKAWNNRIVTNLLYYQSNYFITTLVIVLVLCAINAKAFVVGLSAIAVFVGAFIGVKSSRPQLVQYRAQHPYLVIFLIAAAGYFFIYQLMSVITALFVFAAPLLLVFLHASMHVGNLQSKVNKKLEVLHLRRTFMGSLLDMINIDLVD